MIHSSTKFFVLLLTAIFIGCSVEKPTQESGYFKPVPASFYEGLSFDLPKVPVPEFPDYSVSIEEVGAVPGGNTLNTDASRKPLQHVNEQGGGRVVVPRGSWQPGRMLLNGDNDLEAE